MSFYSDFRREWVERFPDCDLPTKWEEDVQFNLSKHRQRVVSLKEELEKEEFYVNYLEQLLADVEKQKTRAAGDGQAAAEETLHRTDSLESGIESSETSRKFSKSCSQNSIDMCINELADNGPPSSERSISVDDSKPIADDEKNLEQRQRSLTQPNLSHFVTVIEINGKGKKKVEAQPLKKFPPKPPPKTFPKPNFDLLAKSSGPKKSTDEGANVVLPDLEPGQLLKEAGADCEGPPVNSVFNSSAENETSIDASAKPVVSEQVNQNKLSKLIDRFSMSDMESPYGRIKRAGPAPELPSPSPTAKEDDSVSNSGSLGSQKSSGSLEKTKKESDYEEPLEEEEEVEYCGVISPISEKAPTFPQSLNSSLKEHHAVIEEYEPFYDSVCPDDLDFGNRSTELTLPSKGVLRPLATANYVNIDYFIKQRAPETKRLNSVDSEEGGLGEDASIIAESISDGTGTYNSSSSLDSNETRLTGSAASSAVSDMPSKIIDSIIQSEVVYIECLNVLLQYMKALKATLTTSQPVISEDELNTVFYKIPELHKMHSDFLDGLKNSPPFGRHFKTLAENLNDYGAFLHNYGRATDTVKRRCQNSQQFAGITSDIKLKSLQGQSLSLEDLLHKPVARVQKNALVLDDLLSCSLSPSDQEALKDALHLTKTFLDSFNMIETKKMFGHEDRAQRRLVKNSFMVEVVEGHRKLRHLFLFNDVMACAKYKASGRDKFTFELKWYVHLNDLYIQEESGNEPREVNPPNLLALKSQASTLRDQILRDEEKRRSGLDKQRKKLADLEAQLVLAYPDLVLKVGQRGARLFCFLLSSEFERTQWIEAVHALQTISQQSQLPGPKGNTVSMVELQAWVTACRGFLKTNMGSYLLRSAQDESLLRGDLHVRLGHLQGLPHPADLYLVLEVDSYGHYFRKGRSKLVCRSAAPRWDQNFVIDLEGSQNLRVLLYEEAQDRSILRGKCIIRLSLKWLGSAEVMRLINLSSGVSLSIHLKFASIETSVRRVPQAKPSGFGSKIQQVCKREERAVPFLITSCVREVERRGMQEVGVYRVSGSSSDLTKLKKVFETNSYQAEQLLKEVCVHSVTGIMKLYLRELPEALFTDALYEKFLEAWNLGEERRGPALAACYQLLPSQNKEIIDFLLEHLVRVNEQEEVNKMSLHNLATVFGPTLIRPSAKDAKTRDLLMKGTVDVMAQAGILYHFLTNKVAMIHAR